MKSITFSYKEQEEIEKFGLMEFLLEFEGRFRDFLDQIPDYMEERKVVVEISPNHKWRDASNLAQPEVLIMIVVSGFRDKPFLICVSRIAPFHRGFLELSYETVSSNLSVSISGPSQNLAENLPTYWFMNLHELAESLERSNPKVELTRVH